MNKFLIFLSLLSSVLIFSQDIDRYNKIYNKTFLKTAQENFPEAIRVADSLFSVSETPALQSKSLMLSANLYFQKGNVEKSMELALKAKDIIEPTNEYLMQSKIYGFLSSLYMDLNLYKQSKDYFDKCLLISDKIEDKNISNNIQGVISQERAQAEIKFKRYNQSIEYVKKSQYHLNLVKNPQPFLLAKNETLLGENYYLQNYSDKALLHYNKALKISKVIPESYIIGVIYSGFTKIYIDKKDETNAKKYMTLAQKISDKSEFLALKREVNETSEKYYKFTNDLKGLLDVQNKQDLVVEKMQKQKDSFIDKSIVKLKDENAVVREKFSIGKVVIIICLLFLSFALLYFYISRKKNLSDFENFNKVMAELHEKMKEQEDRLQHNLVLNDAQPVIHPSSEKKSSEKAMINATEIKLLKKLQKFEKSTLFLKNSISLSSLSTFCETNPRYLSNVINAEKKMDFSNYISNLRIQYIIQKLEVEPKYRKYKIAALAEDCGFSSANKFATVFKKVTNISPSVFIKYLDEENNGFIN